MSQAKIDPLYPCLLLFALAQPLPSFLCGCLHLDSKDTKHDHLVMPMRGYLIQVVRNNNVDQKIA